MRSFRPSDAALMNADTVFPDAAALSCTSAYSSGVMREYATTVRSRLSDFLRAILRRSYWPQHGTMAAGMWRGLGAKP
ncbi:hypothetical protein XACS582_14260004 [Xanthomonas citri pv. citri]|nr:hypothetical protein XACS584_1840010 [Xanthomonas citri pv. citri]CEF22800.1 hypothetical protein XACJK2_2180025 [Xanthomonas citri pv. citri]CEH59257.1 hypothetical protein XACJK48_9060003 [Xanthomonas citri pv. citri]CEH60293.1 hypothetical protein XACS582_14260004 [Xanthomonas citri pv. citri]CEI02955.1 hypothetical protein XACS581_3440020 [Xanthomonas citri pv. citri]